LTFFLVFWVERNSDSKKNGAYIIRKVKKKAPRSEGEG